jgi:ABC-type lipoprotein export system ATPase subunit
MPNSANPILTASNVSKRYGDREILKGLSFVLGRGERIALMGPSGSGKSTLLNCLGGIDRPESGSIVVGNSDLTKLDAAQLTEARRRKVSTIFQFFHLLPTLTARENIAFPLQLLGLDRADCDARVSQLLEEVDLLHRADALPEHLSGGEMQRVAIARALASRPVVILADEPTGNLDSGTGEAILDLIQALSERHGIALVIVTHSDAVTRICHRVFQLSDGRIDDSVSS